MSSDGRYVAFASDAANLVAGDSNGSRDVFVRDRTAGTTQRVSVNGSGVAGNNDSDTPVISGDGRYVAFTSGASNLVGGDSNIAEDIFVYDRNTGSIQRVSVSSAGIQANADSWGPSLSSDGRYVAFASYASNLVSGDNNNAADIFVYDRTTSAIQRVSVGSGGAQANDESSAPAISGDGRFVAFVSSASNLVAGDSNFSSDVFVYDRNTSTTQRVSVTSGGIQGNDDCFTATISSDGRYVAFACDADNLVAGDSNGVADVFVRDRTNSTTERISISTGNIQGNEVSALPSISGDGRYVAFTSLATNLVTPDTLGTLDVFLRDRTAGTTRRVSTDTAGTAGNEDSDAPRIRSDGLAVAFESYASNLVSADTNGWGDAFVWSDVAPGPASISGNISYFVGARPVASTIINLSGPAVISTLSDATGSYSLADLAAGTWTSQPQKTGDRGSAITALDATFVLQDVVGLRTPSSSERIAADVNGSGSLSAIDATFILQFRVGLISQLPVATACGSDWVFLPIPVGGTQPQIGGGNCTPGSISYPSLSGAATNQNFTAILFGDTNGSWTPTAGAGAVVPSARHGQVAFGPIRRGSSRRKPSALVPVSIVSSQSFESLEMTLRYDPRMARMAGIRRLGDTPGMLLQANTHVPGILRVAIASALPVHNDGRPQFAVVFDGTTEEAARARLRVTKIDLARSPGQE